jgi:hypothetical protein
MRPTFPQISHPTAVFRVVATIVSRDVDRFVAEVETVEL